MQKELKNLIDKGYPAHNVQVREALINEAVTLDGRPARIAGKNLQFPKVAMLGGPAYQYSWAAVLAVVQRGGTFYS